MFLTLKTPGWIRPSNASTSPWSPWSGVLRPPRTLVIATQLDFVPAAGLNKLLFPSGICCRSKTSISKAILCTHESRRLSSASRGNCQDCVRCTGLEKLRLNRTSGITTPRSFLDPAIPPDYEGWEGRQSHWPRRPPSTGLTLVRMMCKFLNIER